MQGGGWVNSGDQVLLLEKGRSENGKMALTLALQEVGTQHFKTQGNEA